MKKCTKNSTFSLHMSYVSYPTILKLLNKFLFYSFHLFHRIFGNSFSLLSLNPPIDYTYSRKIAKI